MVRVVKFDKSSGEVILRLNFMDFSDSDGFDAEQTYTIDEIVENRGVVFDMVLSDEVVIPIEDIIGIEETGEGISVTPMETIQDAIDFVVEQYKRNNFVIKVDNLGYRVDLVSARGSAESFRIPPCVSAVASNALKDVVAETLVIGSSLSDGFDTSSADCASFAKIISYDN